MLQMSLRERIQKQESVWKGRERGGWFLDFGPEKCEVRSEIQSTKEKKIFAKLQTAAT